ncbi:MAG: glycosyltransferase, partial [Chitinivibrionales bacterium]|nr:glycosyltransferase [Chitinivibrionales bacterium]
FDLIHNQFDFLPLTYSRLVNTPVLTTIHGFSSPKILAVYKKYNRACRYVSISNADRSPELTYEATVYHGIDTSGIPFHDSPGGDYLAYFGRFHPDKGAREAVEIARRTGKELVMAGVIQDHRYFEEHVVPAVNEGRVQYLGSIGPDRRNELLGNARALLHPISFDEPFGLSIIESMACGTPVIAFNRGSMPELIEHGKTGFLVSSVEKAVSCVERLDEIDRRACRTVAEERFTKERMAEEYIGLYTKLLSV